MYKSFFLLFLLIILTTATHAQYNVERAFPSLNFERPVDLQHAPNDADRLFLIEQAGLIYVFENRADVQERILFLDIRDRVNDGGNEEGLLGVAFHPDYENNGRFFVDYTASSPRRTVIAEFQVDATDSNRADKNSEKIILEVNQPFTNHNAGQIAFGPDGFLYITFGDGGSGGDPQGNGQNRKTLLGSIARIDVDNSVSDRPYAIPADNPFAGNDLEYREEIYAYGLRNPWRMSFDPITQYLWTADVGQNEYEEINIIENGKNYGWKIMEGLNCYDSNTCDRDGLTLPVWQYSHNLGQSITGGFVYRGNRLPGLVGTYVYADYASGRIWGLDYEPGVEATNALLIDTSLSIPSFGVDANNELYILAFNGFIYQLVDETTSVNKTDVSPSSFVLHANFPNPFNGETVIPYELTEPSTVTLEILNVHGQAVNRTQFYQQPGLHSFRWDARDENSRPLASGVYVATVTDGVTRLSQKLLLIQ